MIKKRAIRIGLIGFGKTGKAVATVILLKKGFTLEWVLRKSELLDHRSVPEFLGINCKSPGLVYSAMNTPINELLDRHPVDMIIDFSAESAIFEYGPMAAERNIKIISAISHYKRETISFIKKLAEKTTVFWSPNITLGINYLLFSAKFLRKIAPWVDVEVVEEHFKDKAGVSGTAIKIAESLGMAKISSIRAGGIVGRHEIIFGFPHQTVRLVHESISREAFGNGALFVAENLMDKEKGYFKFEDILSDYISKIN